MRLKNAQNFKNTLRKSEAEERRGTFVFLCLHKIIGLIEFSANDHQCNIDFSVVLVQVCFKYFFIRASVGSERAATLIATGFMWSM